MFLLKVFSGPQANAIIDLEPEVNYSIANHSDVDIYLEKSLIASPANFIISGGKIIFNQLSSQTIFLDDGSEVEEAIPYLVPIYCQSGEVKFGIGDQLQSWGHHPQQDSLSELEANNNDLDDFVKAFNEHSTLNDQVTQKELDSHTRVDDRQQVLVNNKLTEYLKDKWQVLLKPAKKFYAKNRLGFYTVVVLICLILVTVIYAVIYSKQQQSIDRHNQIFVMKSQTIKKIFAELPSKFTNLSIKRLSQYYLVNGLVYDKKDLNELKDYFKEYLNLTRFEVLTFAEAKGKIKNIMLNYNFTSSNINYDEVNQELVIAGITTSSSTQINDMQIEISNQLAGIPNLRFIIFNRQQIYQDLNDSLGLSNLHLNLSESADPIKPTLQIYGYLTANQLEGLTKNVNELKQKYQSVANINLDIKNSLLALPFKIYNVYTGNPAYITTLDGQVVYVGGELGGFKLIAISNKKIIFGGKMQLEVPLSQINDLSESNSATPINTRQQVLNYEFNRVKELLSEEHEQLEYLNDYYSKINDPKIRGFIQKQIANLNDDIILKQKDLDYYNKVTNTK